MHVTWDSPLLGRKFFFFPYPLSSFLQGVDIPVFVVAGKWECCREGKWDFILENDCFARSISVSAEMTFNELQNAVASAFDFNVQDWKQNISYWLPEQLSIFSARKRPPVCLDSTMALKSFVTVKAMEPHLNLCLSLESILDEGPQKQLVPQLGECSNRGKVTANMAENVITTESEVVMMVTAPTNASKSVADDFGSKWLVRGNRLEGRRLFTEDDNHAAGETSMAGIIRIADAATPSLNNDSERDCIKTYFAEYEEDEVVLREIEAVEKRAAEERARAKGKGKVSCIEEGLLDSDGDAFQSDGLDGYTSGYDGLEDSLSCEEDIDDSQYWADVFDRADPDYELPSGAEDDVVATGAEPENAASEGNENVSNVVEPAVEEDISAAVIAYEAHPMRLEKIYEDVNEEVTSPTTDAQPCFDDALNLSTTEICASVSSSEDAIYVGRVFRDKLHMQTTLAIYAIRWLFHFRQTRSDKSRLVFVCVDSRCAWRVFGHVVAPGSVNFEVRKATLTHTCSVTARAQYGKQATAKVIAEVLRGKYSNGSGGPRTVEIPDIVLSELKVSVTYMKAWYAREAAIIKSRGSEESSYKLLAVYMHLLEQGNPGTIYKLEHTQKASGVQQFKYLSFALGACISGIKYMRKVILVDGTAIKARFKGVLLAASMQDANFQVYPIAFGIVDGENEPSWTWFFRQLSKIVPDSEDLVLVTDRHRAIYAAVGQIYPKAFHGACAVHLERNVRVRWPKHGIPGLVGKAARAYNVGQFNEYYNEIGIRSSKCHQYLEAIPKEHWTQAYCPAKRYNVMSSNIAEALNGALAKILELPIVTMVDGIRGKLMRWFCVRRAKAAKMTDTITPATNKLIFEHNVDSAGLAVSQVLAWSYHVHVSDELSYYVDLEKKSCSCLQFQKLLIPCCHALAAARINNVHIPTLVGEPYMVELFGKQYEQFIYPVPNQADEDIPAVVEDTQFVPPSVRVGPGRRRKRRIPSSGKRFGVMLCHICLFTYSLHINNKIGHAKKVFVHLRVLKDRGLAETSAHCVLKVVITGPFATLLDEKVCKLT